MREEKAGACGAGRLDIISVRQASAALSSSHGGSKMKRVKNQLIGCCCCDTVTL